MNFPTLSTPDFLLRQIAMTDQPRIFEGLSNPEVNSYYGISFRTLEETSEQMTWYKELEENETGIWWAICDADKPGELIGACGFNNWKKDHKCIETGFWLLPQFWRKGVMKKCLPVIFSYAFQELRVHRIEAIVEEGNGASGGLLQSLGFEYEGRLRDAEIKHGKYISLEYYSLLNEEITASGNP